MKSTGDFYNVPEGTGDFYNVPAENNFIYRLGEECRSASEDTYGKNTTATVEEVARAFHKNPETIRAGLKQGRFPWGYAIETSDDRWSYIINRRRFEETEGIVLS